MFMNVNDFENAVQRTVLGYPIGFMGYSFCINSPGKTHEAIKKDTMTAYKITRYMIAAGCTDYAAGEIAEGVGISTQKAAAILRKLAYVERFEVSLSEPLVLTVGEGQKEIQIYSLARFKLRDCL